jgi:hypothetical protein
MVTPVATPLAPLHAIALKVSVLPVGTLMGVLGIKVVVTTAFPVVIFTSLLLIVLLPDGVTLLSPVPVEMGVKVVPFIE